MGRSSELLIKQENGTRPSRSAQFLLPIPWAASDQEETLAEELRVLGGIVTEPL